MKKYIDKDALVAEIEKLHNSYMGYMTNGLIPLETFLNKDAVLINIKTFIDTLEVKEENSVWHNIDDIPNYNLNGISDFIIDSCHGHIHGEAHSYTPEQWAAHIGFNANRDFRWAYENDLIILTNYDTRG